MLSSDPKATITTKLMFSCLSTIDHPILIILIFYASKTLEPAAANIAEEDSTPPRPAANSDILVNFLSSLLYLL